MLEEHKEDNIVIGTHGTAMSTIINYYDKNFDYKQFERIAKLMPFIVCMEFENRELVKVDEFIL